MAKRPSPRRGDERFANDYRGRAAVKCKKEARGHTNELYVQRAAERMHIVKRWRWDMERRRAPGATRAGSALMSPTAQESYLTR